MINSHLKRSRSHSPQNGSKEYSVRKLTGDLDELDFNFIKNDLFSSEEKDLLHRLEASTIYVELSDGTKYQINARFLPGTDQNRGNIENRLINCRKYLITSWIWI